MDKRNTDMQKQAKTSMKSIAETGGDTGIELTEQDLKKVSGGVKANKKL